MKHALLITATIYQAIDHLRDTKWIIGAHRQIVSPDGEKVSRVFRADDMAGYQRGTRVYVLPKAFDLIGDPQREMMEALIERRGYERVDL